MTTHCKTLLHIYNIIQWAIPGKSVTGGGGGGGTQLLFRSNTLKFKLSEMAFDTESYTRGHFV